MMNMTSNGWKCGSCNRVNAPWLPYCDCYKTSYAISTNSVTLGNLTPFCTPVDNKHTEQTDNMVKDNTGE